MRLDHAHQPIYRVVRRSWRDALDTSVSRERGDRRWNTSAFEALYCCCSERVARAVALDVFRMSGVGLEDVQPDYRPQLTEIGWAGRPFDVASDEGVRAAGFPADYPAGVSKSRTRAAAARWHAAGADGVVSRGASLARMGFSEWRGPHEPWGELAIYVEHAPHKPEPLRRRDDLEWLERP